MFRLLSIAFMIGLATSPVPATAQVPNAAARPPRPIPPTRDPNTPGYVTAKDLPDGENAPAKQDGNFILGPTHNPAPEMTVKEGVPQGEIFNFTMESADSKIYPGIAREAGTFARPDPADPAKLVVVRAIRHRTRARSRCMSQSNTWRGRRRRSSWARTVRIRRCSRRWTT